MKNDIPQGYKQTEVGIIPHEWEVIRLGKLCHNQGDYGINAPASEYSNQLPTYLRITDIDEDGKYIIANKVSVNNPNSNSYHLKDGDIVFARTGATVGKTYLYNQADGDLVFAGFLIRFSPDKQKIVPYYLKAYTNTVAYCKWIKITSLRSGQPGINAREFCSLQIPVPPVEEQRKIAEILGVWDKAIELQAQLIDKLELRKRALMQRLFSGRHRLPGFSEKWTSCKINKIAKIKKGAQVNKDVLFSNAKFPVINGGITPSGYLDNYNTEANTITISEGGNSCGYVNFMTVPFWSGGHCYTINVKDRVDNVFIYQLLKYNEKHIMSLRVGSGLPNIQIKDLENIKLELPGNREQTAIAEVLSTADKEIELAKSKLAAYRTQKRGLMQQLLTGKKRVKL